MSLFLATLIATVTTNVPLPGGDAEAFGCIPSAGYQWCSAKQKCYRPWEESCAATTHTPTTTTTHTPTAPNCGGNLNCVAYNDGCNSCNCVDRGTLCTTKFCVQPAPEMVSVSPVRRCTACTDGYVLNPITYECKPSASCGGFAHCGEYRVGWSMGACWGYTISGIYYPGSHLMAHGHPIPHEKAPPTHCTSCIDGYVLNRESNECVRLMEPPCMMAPCVNPCEQFKGFYVNGDWMFAYCKGHPNTRCEGLADCNRGCWPTYFDSVTDEEIVDCVLIWEVYNPYHSGITTM